MKSSKHTLILILLTLLYSTLLLFLGLFARNNFVDKTKPFPSWTYTHSLSFINALTSWDSGFYYDLAKAGYQNSTEKIPMTTILVAPDSWVKVFTGSGIIGKEKYALPYSQNDVKVSNVVFVYNGGLEPASFPIYYAYSGIPYCEYFGSVEYDRDVQPAAQALTNPSACGDSACNSSYVTYYDTLAEKVVFQEVFTAESSSTPKITLGSTRPVFNTEQAYRGTGCETVERADISDQPLSSYKSAYSTFAFMPLYSLLSRALAVVVQDVVVAGLLVSLICFMLSVLVFYKLARDLVGDSNVALWSALAFMVLPASFFDITFQPVSLFLLLFTLALLMALKKNYAMVALVFALLVLTHTLGVFAIIPLFYMTEKNKKSLALNFAALLMVVVLVSVYFYTKTTDPFVLLSARMPWYGGAVTFVGSFVNYFLNLNKYVIFEVVLTLAFLVVMYVLSRTATVTKKAELSHISVFSFISMFLLMSVFNGSFAGMVKFLPTALVPLAIYLGIVCSDKKWVRLLLVALVVLNVILFCLWTVSSRFVI